MKLLSFLLLCLSTSVLAQAPEAPPDTWKALGFLEGTWIAQGKGIEAASVSGAYTFRLELDKHVMARHSRTADCKAASAFDCEHGDLLYIYADAPGKPLKAIYFDSEGHVIHYDVTMPSPTSVIFLSDGTQPGPQFRLLYERSGSVMSGKFQARLPGQGEWRSYLEWSGAKSDSNR